MTKYALISVSDKTGIIPMSHFLFSQGYTILSTGGTYRHIYDNLPEVKAQTASSRCPISPGSQDFRWPCKDSPPKNIRRTSMG